MIIIAGYTLTEAHKRDAAVEAFAAMVERARKYDCAFRGAIRLSCGRPSSQINQSYTSELNYLQTLREKGARLQASA